MGQRNEALYPDFGMLMPQDGSVETIQDYTYRPDSNIRIGTAAPITRKVLRFERFDPNDPMFVPPLALWKGLFLRIPCVNGYGYRFIHRVAGNIIELDSALNSDPIPGHTGVRIVTGYAQHYIDMKLFDLWEKGKLEIKNGRYYKIER